MTKTSLHKPWCTHETHLKNDWLQHKGDEGAVKRLNAAHCCVSLHSQSTVLHLATESIIYKQLASQVTCPSLALLSLPLKASLAAFLPPFSHFSLTPIFMSLSVSLKPLFSLSPQELACLSPSFLMAACLWWSYSRKIRSCWLWSAGSCSSTSSLWIKSSKTIQVHTCQEVNVGI